MKTNTDKTQNNLFIKSNKSPQLKLIHNKEVK